MVKKMSGLMSMHASIRAMMFALIVVMTVALCGCSQASSYSSASLENELALAETGESADDAQISLEIGWDAANGGRPVESLPVSIVGKTVDGVEVNKSVTAVVGATKELDLKPGTYTFSFEAFLSTDGKRAFKGATSVYVFDGKTENTVKLLIVSDDEKTAEIAAADEAARIAAEAEAAAAAQAEAEAKAQAEAAAAAQAQAAAKQAQSNSGGGTVYVAASGKGKKYHSNPSCSKMNGTISMTVSEAKAAGYTPCSKCY